MKDEMARQKTLAEKIISNIDPEVRASFNADQLASIEKALVENIPRIKDHAVDIHGVLPLLFRRLYFVFFAGKDTRETTVEVEYDERTETPAQRLIGFILAVLFFSCILGYFCMLIFEGLFS